MSDLSENEDDRPGDMPEVCVITALEALSEPGGVFRDETASSIDYEALMEEELVGERRNPLLHGSDSDYGEEESSEARDRRYRGAQLGKVSDPEHWMSLHHFESEDSDMEEEEIAIDSPTEERGHGREQGEPPMRRRRVEEEPEPEDQEELVPEQLDMIRGGIRVLDYDYEARAGEVYLYRFPGGRLELRYRDRGEGHEQHDERIRRILQPLSRRLGMS